jgi:hypothetical protein
MEAVTTRAFPAILDCGSARSRGSRSSDRSTASGQRDQALLALICNTWAHLEDALNTYFLREHV